MNKRIDFTNLGGFPVVQETFKWMQDSFRGAFGAVAGLCGDKVILYGCTVAGGNVSGGWVVINGELLPFVGAAYAPGAEVVVIETPSPALFEDGVSRDVYFEKYATIGSPGGFPFTDLKPIGPLRGAFEPGMIMMWSGAVNAVPAGWALCDGTNGTPNLKGRFIVGYDPADPDYNAIGKTGGEKAHLLTQAEMPAHSHQTTIPSKDFDTQTNNGPNLTGPGDGALSTQTFATNSMGGNQPHENRPPFYTLAFIIKL